MHDILQQLDREISTILGDLDVTQTQLRPVEGVASWSIQQIMEHLLLTYASTCALLEARLAKGTPTGTLPTLWQRVSQYAVCRFGYFPHGRRSPEEVAPSAVCASASGEQLAVRAHDLLIRLNGLIEEAERRFGDVRMATHHVLGPLKARQWCRFHLIHGRHHLRRIRAIRDRYGI